MMSKANKVDTPVSRGEEITRELSKRVDEIVNDLRSSLPSGWDANTRYDIGERNSRNSFLKRNGYRWTKIGRVWILVGINDRIQGDGNVKNLLVNLGYFGDIGKKYVRALALRRAVQSLVRDYRERELERKRDEVLASNPRVQLRMCYGDYYSGYIPADQESTELLKTFPELEIVGCYKYIRGWGDAVRGVKDLSSFRQEENGSFSFSLSELVQNCRDKISKMKQKKKNAEVVVKRKQKAALEKAARTGEIVFVRTVGGHDGDSDPRWDGEEAGWVNVNEYATPDGRIIVREDPTY